MNTHPDNDTDTELRIKIHRETARLPWAELERHFAQGSVIFVSPELDLIDVAVRIAHDDKDSVTRWIADGQLGKVSDLQARAWTEAQATLWASVVSPFVLVQPEKARPH